MTATLRDLRVLVTHDWLVPWAGAERVLAEIMNVVPQADLVVGVRAGQIRHLNAVTRKARETWVGRIPFARDFHRWFVPLHYAAFARLDTSRYDLVISSSHAFAKAVRPASGRPHICYCHSPPRYLWDMGLAYREQSNVLGATALQVTTPLLCALDRRTAAGVTHFVSNSAYVARRIEAAYGRDATVVFPPVEPKPAMPKPREDFLLVLGRLVAYKRVDLAIQAAERLGIPLVVAGSGRERASLERLAGPNVTFLGEVDEATAGDLMERCRAFVFCAEEDFGIAPVEANAHGAPVVAFGRGGVTESMVRDETAVLFDRQDVDAVARAIECAMGRAWDERAIRANAARFAPARFRDAFSAVVRSAVF